MNDLVNKSGDLVKDLVNDCISRAAAIEALGEKPLAWTESEYEQGLQNQWKQDVDALMELPAAQPTLYGYSIESLAAVAEIMKKGDMSPEEARWTFQNNVVRIAELIRAEWYENIQKQFEQMMFAGGENGTD